MKNGKGNPERIILILERQHIVGFDLIQSLKDKGYDVVLESNFKEAGLVVANLKPDFIISEFSAFQELLSRQDFKAFKKSYHLTGESMIVHTKELEILAAFEKPFHSRDLVQFLDKYLKLI